MGEQLEEAAVRRGEEGGGMTPLDVIEGRARWCVVEADCLDALPAIHGADITITDPPYNVGLDYCDGDNRIDYAEWSSAWFRLARRTLVFTPGSVNLGMWFDIEHPTWTCAWVKTNQNSFSKLGGPNMWEPVLVYGKTKHRVDRNVWVVPIAAQAEAKSHPCPKSLRFWTELVRSFAKEDQIVVDPFAGSGTTGLACLRLGRRFIGIEKHGPYAALARERLRAEESSTTLRAARAGQIPMFGAR